MRRSFRDSSRSIVVFALFSVFVVGQTIAGFFGYNSTEREHGRCSVGYTDYLRSGDFVEAVFANWESEFLAVGALAVLSIYLRQEALPSRNRLPSCTARREDESLIQLCAGRASGPPHRVTITRPTEELVEPGEWE